MATSSVEDLPRNLEFLFSLNRLNVAVSRARGLSILVCSPELLRARCHSPEQMRLVNALCRFVAMAEPWASAPRAKLCCPHDRRQRSTSAWCSHSRPRTEKEAVLARLG